MKRPPITFTPFLKPVVWGGHHLKSVYGDRCPDGPVGEAWIVSAREGAESIVSGGAHDGRPLSAVIADDPVGWLGREIVAETGPEFPLLIKILDATQNLSMQVHPDARTARRRGGDAHSKTECWWILGREPDAALYLGLEDGVTEDALRAGIADGLVRDMVQSHPVQPGEVYFVPSGAVHAIGAGVRLLEIQETSDTTYRLYDWDRVGTDGTPRELHVDAGLEAARARPRAAGLARSRPVAGLAYERDRLVDCDVFALERLTFEGIVPGRTDGRRFHLAIVVDGSVKLEAGGRTYGPFKPWSPILLPADLGAYRLVSKKGATIALTAPGPGSIYTPDRDLVRLQKYLAAAGIGSRRECERLMTEGRVSVDGEVADQLGMKVDPDAMDVRIDGERVKRAESKVYYLLNKPKGVVCTSAEDRSGRPRAIDLIGDARRRIYTIGRLDLDSEGIIVLTNDGELAFRVAHPRFGIPKVYLVQVRGRVSPDAIRKMERGVFLSDGRTEGFGVQLRRVMQGTSWLRVTLREGKNREIRRVFAKLGFPVKSLRRVRIGNLTSHGLPVGRTRPLREDEVAELLAFDDESFLRLSPEADDAFLPRPPKRPTRGRGPQRGAAARSDRRRVGAGPQGDRDRQRGGRDGQRQPARGDRTERPGDRDRRGPRAGSTRGGGGSSRGSRTPNRGPRRGGGPRRGPTNRR